MSLSPAPSASELSAIILVEDYDALAAAITAALRKFAPAAVTRVVRSLAEAEAASAATAVNLLVVDFDPPHRAAVQFFSRLQTTMPDARALVIGTGCAPEVLRARPRRCALQFVDKPFELAEFGTLINMLLGGRSELARFPSLGRLRDFNLLDGVPLQCLSRETAVLRVETAGRPAGEIYFRRGEIVDASIGRAAGIDALEQMLNLAAARMIVAPSETEARRSMRTPWPLLLAELIPSLPPMDEPARPDIITTPTEPVITGPVKKIVVIDDTEMLRIFVHEILSTANPALTIVTASNGAEGVAQVRSAEPDLVVLDYSLPDFNGDEVCRRLLDDEATKRIPVIMMSGHVPEMMSSAARFQNIVATLAKPFLSPALVELVTETLENPPVFKARPEISAPPLEQPERKGISQAPHPAPAPPRAIVPPASQPPTTAEPAPLPPVRAPSSFPLEPARLANETSNAVIVAMPLEVLSMQFSPALRMAALRARPSLRTVSLQTRGTAQSVSLSPDAAFDVDRVDLDARGQIHTMRVCPAPQPRCAAALPHGVRIGAVSLVPSHCQGAMQLTPEADTPLKIELLALFELAGVELSETFGVAFLLLRACPVPLRISFQRDAAKPGATFATAQVLLDRSARIAEILLDSAA